MVYHSEPYLRRNQLKEDIGKYIDEWNREDNDEHTHIPYKVTSSPKNDVRMHPHPPPLSLLPGHKSKYLLETGIENVPHIISTCHLAN